MACYRRVEELGGVVVEEFVDAGESARTADRPELQRMLARIEAGGVDYVVVHKLDRLARDRGDDAAIASLVRGAGAVLVSVSEQIDSTPSGMLMHGIMATLAEYYSVNLSAEAKKGIAQKARAGGTHGVAPIGYLNTLSRESGREVKGIAVDKERALHVRWAFASYATGEWSLSGLRDELASRGLRSRTTQKYVGTPLRAGQIHRMLSNPYYIGKVRHRGAIYDGAHTPLVDETTFFLVQEVLAGRRIAGDRSWKHSHYLKGEVLRCGRCEGRMGYGHSRGKGGGMYSYFFCLERHTGRSDCDLPYVGEEAVEKAVEALWRNTVRFTSAFIRSAREYAHEELEQHFTLSNKLAAKQRDRLVSLERQKQKLLDAYLADAIAIEDLKQRQAQVLAEIAEAKRIVEDSAQNQEVTRAQLETVLALMGTAVELYLAGDDQTKALLNQVVWERLWVDVEEDDAPGQTQRSSSVRGELSAVMKAVVGVGAESTVERATSTAERRADIEQQRTPATLSRDEGSNVNHLAVTVGFEPES